MRVFLACALAGFLATSLPGAGQASEALKPVAAFAGIEVDAVRAGAIFTEAARVFTHARCVNCHPATDRPLQSDRSRPHLPVVRGGEEGFGTPGLKCVSCHQEANSVGGVPGGPHWHVAPVVMSFHDKSAAQICNQIKDPETNGDRSLSVIMMHVTFDPLIKWAWEPGGDRSPAPGSHQDFVALINAWIGAGAACPAD